MSKYFHKYATEKIFCNCTIFKFYEKRYMNNNPIVFARKSRVTNDKCCEIINSSAYSFQSVGNVLFSRLLGITLSIINNK